MHSGQNPFSGVMLAPVIVWQYEAAGLAKSGINARNPIVSKVVLCCTGPNAVLLPGAMSQ